MYHIFIGYLFTGCLYAWLIVELTRKPRGPEGLIFLQRARTRAFLPVIYVFFAIFLWFPICLFTIRSRPIGSIMVIITGGTLTYLFSEISRFFH